MHPVLLGKDGDEQRRLFQERLVRVGAQRRQGVQPFLRRAPSVELALFFFSRHAHLAFAFGVADDAEKPGLLVGA